MKGNCPDVIKEVYNDLSKVHATAVDAEASELLGFRIRRDRSTRKLYLSQCATIDKAITKSPRPTGKKPCKPRILFKGIKPKMC
jgi:hypothetical protein